MGKTNTTAQTGQTGQTVTENTVDPVEQAKTEAQAILDAAKAEAEKIKQEAQEKGEAEAKAAFDAAKAELEANAAKTGQPPARAPAAGPKMVKIRLFKDNDKYKDDVFVAVNGKSFQIKRGEEVEVPDYVWEVLERQMAQDQATANLISRQSDEYAAEAARRGL